MWRRVSVLVVLAAVAFGANGCAKAQAKTQPVAPALEVPPPPPRLVTPAPEPTLPVVALPAEPAPSMPPARRPANNRGDATRTGEASRTDPKTETPPKEDPARPSNADPTGAVLQTTPPGGEDEAVRNVRALLGRADQALKRVDYGALDRNGRGQYDMVKRFIEQADQALREKNYVFALKLADKAATLAASLAGL